jgi:pyranose oxidase
VETNSVDVLIIGSGPIGCTYARQLVDGDPRLKVLMVDLGSQLSARPGSNAKNVYLYNYSEDGLDALSEVVRGELTATSTPVEQPWPETLDPVSQPRTPPVRYAINGGNPDQADWDNMPAAASSFNVGGMGGHWTCCTPRPVGPERIPFIPDNELDDLFGRSEALLRTNQVSFTESLRGQTVRQALSSVFDKDLPAGRKVQMLPLACERRNSRWVEWTGPDTILGQLAEPDGFASGRFSLRPETICRRLLVNGDRVTGAELEHLPSGRAYQVDASLVIVAANTFYTPQLLWASDIRPAALGHYLNDQPMLFCQVVLKKELIEEIAKRWNPPPPHRDPVPIPPDDPIPNVWIPFSVEHPYHCQIHRDAFPYSQLPADVGVDHRSIIELRWFARKEVRFDDHITFSEQHRDMYGMPQVTFHYQYSPQDQATIDGAFADMAKAAEAIGGYLPGREPAMLPRGSSLHYMGTFRMGESDDGASVTDPYSRVWGFRNLYLGGNGIIPTSTACNPTMTSMALAIRAAQRILADWTQIAEGRELILANGRR